MKSDDVIIYIMRRWAINDLPMRQDTIQLSFNFQLPEIDSTQNKPNGNIDCLPSHVTQISTCKVALCIPISFAKFTAKLTEVLILLQYLK